MAAVCSYERNLQVNTDGNDCAMTRQLVQSAVMRKDLELKGGIIPRDPACTN